MNALHHAIYTNAAGSDGRGFRFIHRATAWSATDRGRLERWLHDLEVADTATPMNTCAVRALRLGGAIHACLVAADGRFGVDAHGRAARLTHAVLAPLDEGTPAADWGSDLLAVRRAFGRPTESPDLRLDAYVARCAAQRTCAPEPLTPNRVGAIDDAAVRRVFSCAASMAPELVLGAVEDVAAAMMGVTAWLPPRLRLAFRWTWGFGPVQGATRVRSSPARPSSERPSSEPSTAGLDPRATAYAAWLRATRDPSLAADWHPRSWDELMAATMSS